MTLIKNINYAQLVDFVNEEFRRLEITGYKAYRAERTYHRPCDYEAGACKMLIWFKHLDTPEDSLLAKRYFMCDYSLKELNEYRKSGYKMYLKFRFRSSNFMLTDLEIDVRKINK